MTRLTATSFVLLAALFWGLVSIFVKGVLDAGVGALEVAFWRCLLGGALFGVHALVRRNLRLSGPADLGTFAAFALLVIVTHFVTFNAAVLHSGVGLVNLFLTTIPALIALGATISGERPNPGTFGLVGLSSRCTPGKPRDSRGAPVSHAAG